MQTISSGPVNNPGVVAYYKHSLSFSVTEDTLLLQSGAILTSNGTYIVFDEPPYTVCENIELTFFENKKHYYFYLYHGSILKKDVNNYLLHNRIDEGLHFIISEKIEEKMVLLGEVSISYNTKNNKEKRALRVARNAFEPQSNEIDIRQRNNIILSNHIMSKDERNWFSEPLYSLAETLYKKMKNENKKEIGILSSAFFSFYETVETSDISYAELYRKCFHNTKLFSWIDQSIYSDETNKYFKLLETQVFDEPHAYSCEYYTIDKDKEDNFFHAYTQQIKNLTEALLDNNSSNKKVNEQKKLIELSKDISTNPNYEFEAVLPSSFMLENEDELPKEEPTSIAHATKDDEHEDTVLVGGNHSLKKFVQIGRSESSANDIVLGKDDTSISRVHAKITAHEQGFFIEDTSSMGTYVDGERIEKNTKKFVTTDNHIVLGKKGYILDLTQHEIQALRS